LKRGSKGDLAYRAQEKGSFINDSEAEASESVADC
jgi:hypothetical protein